MRKTTWISSLLLLFLAACNNRSGSETETAPAPATQQGEFGANDISASFQKGLPLWLEWIKSHHASFTVDSLVNTESGTQQPLPAYPIDTARLRPVRSLLIYNGDSTQAIDLFSNNYVFSSRDGKTVAEEAGPDTEVQWIDFKNGKMQRLWYSGPGATVQDAAWINGDTVAIAGMQETEKGERHPAIWVLSLPNHTIDTYVYRQPVTASAADYQNRRFTTVMFR